MRCVPTPAASVLAMYAVSACVISGGASKPKPSTITYVTAPKSAQLGRYQARRGDDTPHKPDWPSQQRWDSEQAGFTLHEQQPAQPHSSSPQTAYEREHVRHM